MGEYRLPWEPKPPAPPAPPVDPTSPSHWKNWGKPKNPTPPNWSIYKPGAIIGGYTDPKTLRCIPIIPNPIKQISGKGDGEGGGNNGGGTSGGQVKVVNPSNFVENSSTTQPDYAAESLVAFNNLTTIEILEISRSGNIDVNARNLNPNILDIVDVVNTFSPTEIIKLQTTLDTFFSPFEENLAENSFDITTIPGIAEIKIPQKNDNNLSKTQIQVLAPKKIQRDTIYI